jgi:propanol-preferring alcohol dehydrogenase
MKAYRVHAWQTDATFDDIPQPEPGPGEVLIRIAGAGVCSSDLHVVHEWTPETVPQAAGWKMPWTLGHENGGWIEGGDTVFDIGTPVVINSIWNCGYCRSCRAGATNYCETPRPEGGSGGLGRNGGMAEYMVAPAHCVVPLKSIDPADAAPFTDAGLTSYHAVKQVLPILAPDTAAVVIGVGGLGHLAVELLRELSGAKIIAVDRDKAALKLAADRGADLWLPSDETTADRIMDATDGLGAVAVLDIVGVNATLQMAVQSLRRRGRIVIVGIGGGTYPLGYTSIPPGASIMTTLGGSNAELAEVVALAEAGRLRPHTTKFSLDEAPEVFKNLHAGKISGRAVLVP